MFCFRLIIVLLSAAGLIGVGPVPQSCQDGCHLSVTKWSCIFTDCFSPRSLKSPSHDLSIYQRESANSEATATTNVRAAKNPSRIDKVLFYRLPSHRLLDTHSSSQNASFDIHCFRSARQDESHRFDESPWCSRLPVVSGCWCDTRHCPDLSEIPISPQTRTSYHIQDEHRYLCIFITCELKSYLPVFFCHLARLKF